MPNQLATSILQTLAYASIFNYPLTLEEILHKLWQPERVHSHADINQALRSLTASNRIKEQDGFYCLTDEISYIAERQLAIRSIEKKLQIAKRAAKILSFVPFLEAMFVCNTVAAGTAAPDSDIDAFIVVRDGRLWIARLLATLLLSLFRLRRHGALITDRVCLSFYATRGALDFSSIQIAEPDIYLAYWTRELIPIYDPQNLFGAIQAQNAWTKKYLPNEQKTYSLISRYKVNDSRFSEAIKKFFQTAWGGAYGNIVEAQAKSAQLTRMKISGRSAEEMPGAGVIISDTMLKFHEDDRRMFYKNEWIKAYDALMKLETRN